MAQLQTPASRLTRASSDLDRLLRDVQLGPRSHAEVERQVAEGERIAAEIRAVFRSPSRPSAAPLFVSADGHSAGW